MSRRRQDSSLERNDKNSFFVDNVDSKELLLPRTHNNKQQHHHADEKHESSDLRGDQTNIAILFFLYLLQGIPLGLTGAIPMLLQNRGASYKQQAEFSFAFWPFSLKLFWAPIVDSLYFSKFGRRKSWLIPTQYLIGMFMILLSRHVDQWLGITVISTTDSGGDGDGGSDIIEPNVQVLATYFFALNFLAATQDIAVDGWALTMLKRCNVGHASTCNSVGQTAGYFFGYVAFIALESKDFCNTYLRVEPKDTGLVTLPDFLWFWGICFLITTTLVAIFKHENDDVKRSEIDSRNTEKEEELNILDTYKMLIQIIKLKPIRILIVILLTVKATFAACDAVTPLKLIDAGVPKEKLALLAIPVIPLQIILPLIISRYTAGPKPMKVYLKAHPCRMLSSIAVLIIVYITPSIVQDGVPYYYYVLLVANYCIYQVFLYCMFVAVMAFFAKISDPAVGGTYMTLLNTICNLGGNWPNTIALWLVDVLTWKKCINSNGDTSEDNLCFTKTDEEECAKMGGKCSTVIDGYYIESIICTIYGLIWLYFGRKYVNYLQNLPMRAWMVTKRSSSRGKNS